MPQQSTGNARDAQKRNKLFKELEEYCVQWITGGHDVSSQDFMTAIAKAFVELPSQKQKDHPEISGNFGKDFFKRYSDLEKKRKEAKRARGCGYTHAHWLSQLKKIVVKYGFSKSCVFSAIEFGFITERSSGSNLITCHRPRKLNRQPHRLISAILVTSMTGEFLPFRAVMKVPDAPPKSHESSGYSIQIATNEDGWATGHDWVLWLKDHFDPQTKLYLDTPDGSRLLLVNTFTSPISEKFFVECFARRIICVSYPKPPNVEKFDPFLRGAICAKLTVFFGGWMNDRLESAHSRGETKVSLCSRSFAGLIEEICFTEPRTDENRSATQTAWQRSRSMFHLLDTNCKENGRASTPGVGRLTLGGQGVKVETPQLEAPRGDGRAVPDVIDLVSDFDPSETPPRASYSSRRSSTAVGGYDTASSNHGRMQTPISTSGFIDCSVSSGTRSGTRKRRSSQAPDSPCPSNTRPRLSTQNAGPIENPAAPISLNSHRHISSEDRNSGSSSDFRSSDRPAFSSVSRDDRSNQTGLPRNSRISTSERVKISLAVRKLRKADAFKELLKAMDTCGLPLEEREKTIRSLTLELDRTSRS